MPYNENLCDICEASTEGGCMVWDGPPFGKTNRTQRTLCSCCVCAIKPVVLPMDGDPAGIAIIGTNGGDIQTLSEMLGDGFDKKESTKSLRLVGQAFELPAAAIRQKLKS